MADFWLEAGENTTVNIQKGRMGTSNRDKSSSQENAEGESVGPGEWVDMEGNCKQEEGGVLVTPEVPASRHCWKDLETSEDDATRETGAWKTPFCCHCC
jgi:hypothetical protein